MISKTIHFCWLSGDEYPPLIKKCIATWNKKLPDYEIVCWDKQKFPVDSIAWVKEAFLAKKYAFAADYIRFYALYNYGGIYLDSDVEVLKSFNDLLSNKSFLGYENVSGLLEPAIIGAEKGTPWCKGIMDYYEGRHFWGETPTIAPIVISDFFRKEFFDFPDKPVTEKKLIADASILLCPATYFSPIRTDKDKNYNEKNKDVSQGLRNNPETYCIHRFNGSWVSPFRKRLYDFLDHHIGMNKIYKIRKCLFRK